MRGECYRFDNIRLKEKEKAMALSQTFKITEQHWKELVQQGLATIQIEILPCNGKRISYHLI